MNEISYTWTNGDSFGEERPGGTALNIYSQLRPNLSKAWRTVTAIRHILCSSRSTASTLPNILPHSDTVFSLEMPHAAL